MLPFFSKKWEKIQAWLQAAAKSPAKREDMAYHVLCVDDDPDFCAYLQQLASSLKIGLDKAYSIEEAKQKIEEGGQYQAFIIDGHLPDGSGFELVAWLREKKKLDLPIGFLSRIYHDAASFRILKEALNVDLVLEKPINPQEAEYLFKQLCHIEPTSSLDQPLPADFLADIREAYQKSIFDKIERLEKLILIVQKEPTIENVQVLKADVHKIAGSSGSYGYFKVSQLCKQLEDELSRQIEALRLGTFNPSWTASLDEFFTKIKMGFQMAEREGGEQKKEPGSFQHSALLYAITADQPSIACLEQSGKDNVAAALIEENPEVAIKKLFSSEIVPHVLLVQAHYDHSSLTGEDLIRSFYQREDSFFNSIGFLTESQDSNKQAEAIKEGLALVSTLPLSTQALKLLLEPPPSQPILEGYKVLIADDDPDVCQYIVQALKPLGAELEWTTNFSELSARVSHFQPDVILLNISLSDENSFEILNQLKSLHNDNLLIAMVTVSQEARLIEKVYEANVDDILFKPLDRVTLQKRLFSSLKKMYRLAYKTHHNALTGLFNAQAFYDYLQKRYLQGYHFSAAHTLAILELSPLEGVSDQEDHLPEEHILKKLSQSIPDLFKKCEMAAYLGKGRFGLIFNDIDEHFGRLFLQHFLENLSRDVPDSKDIHFHGVVLSLLKNYQSLEQINQDIEKALTKAKQDNQQISVLTLSEPEVTKGQKVLLTGEASFSLDPLKQVFDQSGFEAMQIEWAEEEINERLSANQSTWPLLVLSGPLAGTHAQTLLKRANASMHLHIPILFFSKLKSPHYLIRLLNELDYLRYPFKLIILIEEMDIENA
ncbi:response regulator [Candidatus Protochlamydia phocaeensis]|uniref:response regulator n=1 Tax=Candidatus Protochlamydia phocaeensis TaxID=1414722 RepID=UPI0008385C71|nr:response regulator [Candidatus Protochlamydia phocaeensis]